MVGVLATARTIVSSDGGDNSIFDVDDNLGNSYSVDSLYNVVDNFESDFNGGDDGGNFNGGDGEGKDGGRIR